MKTRPCSVAGIFYPEEPNHLEQLLEKFFRGKEQRISARGVVAPHAGYIYSGETAATAFSAIDSGFSGTFVIIGPSHRGFLTCASAIPWDTPLGIVDTDSEFVDALGIEVDEISHVEEHSIETQVPFVKYRFPRARIAPIMMGDQDIEAAIALGETIVDAAHATKRDIIIVASSDFSHYVPDKSARENDGYAIAALRALDITEFYRRIGERGVSTCGYGPIAAACTACRSLGATEARLLSYTTSGDATGNYASVVGYAALAIA